MRTVFVVTLLFLAGCRAERQTPQTTANVPAAEIDVLVTFMQRQYESYVRSSTPLVMWDTFSIAILRSGNDSHDEFARSLLSQASEHVPADLIRDFCEKNAEPQPVWPPLASRLSVKFLSRQELDSIFSGGVEGRSDGWDRFYARFPRSPGIITVSRVGFNRQGDMAMLYVGSQTHFVAGSGRIHVFRKRDGKWVEKPIFFGPSWVS